MKFDLLMMPIPPGRDLAPEPEKATGNDNSQAN